MNVSQTADTAVGPTADRYKGGDLAKLANMEDKARQDTLDTST